MARRKSKPKKKSKKKVDIILDVGSDDETIISKVTGASLNTEEDESSFLFNDPTLLEDLLQEEYGMNMKLYKFNMDEEFDNGKRKNLKLLNAFINFSRNQGAILTGFNVLQLLQNWAPELKCFKLLTEIEDLQSNQEKKKINFILKGLHVACKQKTKPLRTIAGRIIKFYAKIFNMRENDKSITTAVYTFPTFYISVYDSSAKEEKDIIAAITFKRDNNNANAYIFWLGVRQLLTKICKEDILFNSFNGTYQRIGFSTFLIIVLIKYCSIDSEKETNIYLQCSGNSTNALNFYTRNDFYNNKNDKRLVPKLVRPNDLFWIDEDQISLMICKHGYFYGKQQNNTFIDNDDDNEYTFDNNISTAIDLTTKEMCQKNDLTEEKRLTLIKKITETDSLFSAAIYLKSIDYDYAKQCYPPEGEYMKIREKTFLIYPPNNNMVDDLGPLNKATLDILRNNAPIIREYITDIHDEFSLENNLLPSSRLYIDQRIRFSDQTFLPWDLMAIFLNIFLAIQQDKQYYNSSWIRCCNSKIIERM